MENLDRINDQLINLFGTDTVTGRAMWRIVWSEDQFEKRLMDVTDEGLSLLTPEVREVPKYRQWIREKYVLERLVLVPEVSQKELAGVKLSYEPIFPFEDKNGNALPPNIDAAKFVIDTVYAAMGKTSLKKYTDPEADPETKRKRVDKLVEEIFGNETDVTDHLSRQTGVVISDDKFKIH